MCLSRVASGGENGRGPLILHQELRSPRGVQARTGDFKGHGWAGKILSDRDSADTAAFEYAMHIPALEGFGLNCRAVPIPVQECSAWAEDVAAGNI